MSFLSNEYLANAVVRNTAKTIILMVETTILYMLLH